MMSPGWRSRLPRPKQPEKKSGTCSARSAASPGVEPAVPWQGPAVLHGLRNRGADLAQERLIHREGLVGALQHQHPALSGEQPGDEISRERTEHQEVRARRP